jgi:hypothetical protein
MITNPARNTHIRIINAIATLRRGEIGKRALLLFEFGVSLFSAILGKGVTVIVVVAAGKISVMTGRGINVDVGVEVGVSDGVLVAEGVP